MASDKVGLLLMFILPLILVVVITIIQDSAFKIVNENKIELLVVNHDTGSQGEKLVTLLNASPMFDVHNKKGYAPDIQQELLNSGSKIAMVIPKEFSERLGQKSNIISHIMLSDFGLSEGKAYNKERFQPSIIDFYHDPVLQDNYTYSIINIINTYLDILENSMMIEKIYANMQVETAPTDMKEFIMSNKTIINKKVASNDKRYIPNSTQHNVPAWTIFAMFFMVISLGGNVVRERASGSFIRLKTMPSRFSLVLISKVIIYLIVSILQVSLIFSVGIFLFPYLGLPRLVLPSESFFLTLIVVISGLVAVSYALMIGSVSKTQEQSNGIGAVSVIIFAALGGIWVPVFVMPEYMKLISKFSPLQWCLDGFYTLFLKGGNWSELYQVIITLLGFTSLFLLITFYKLKQEKII